MIEILFLTALLAEMQVASSQQVAFDHPPEGFVFRDPNKVMLAFKISHCNSSDCGHIAIEVGGVQLSRFDMEPNEYGEIRAHAMLPGLPDGEFVAAVKLVSKDGVPLGDEFHHDVGFSVDTVSPIPDPPEAWPERRRALLEGMCPAAVDCEVAALDTGGERGAVCGGRGECHRGACVCDANWCGARCEHPILENSTYLPEQDPAKAPARCMKSLWWENATETLTENLLDIAERTTCRPDQVLVFEVRRAAAPAMARPTTAAPHGPSPCRPRAAAARSRRPRARAGCGHRGRGGAARRAEATLGGGSRGGLARE
jgi:hypothetical protein